LEIRKIEHPNSNRASRASADSPRTKKGNAWQAGRVLVTPKIKPEFSAVRENYSKEENELSEGAKAIMDSAAAISANCWSYCCASSLYVIFLQNVRFGIISAVGSVILSLNAICVNMLILGFLSAEKLSYQIKENNISISSRALESGDKRSAKNYK